MKYSAIVVDDESGARSSMIDKLRTYCPMVHPIFEASSASAAIPIIIKLNPDILFLDIAMPEMDGFELLRSIPEYLGAVIFVTGYNEYAIQAFKVHALDYILKPVDTDRLIDSVNRLAGLLATKISQKGSFDRIKQMIHSDSPAYSKLAVPTRNGHIFILIGDIIKCESSLKNTIIYHKEEQTISSKNLGYFIDVLTGFGFFTMHRSHLVNLRYVESYTREGLVRLVDGSYVPLSKRRKSEFLHQFENLKD